MTALASRRVLLVIGGGIAAYKTLLLIRELRRAGAGVRVVLTQAALQFVTPLTVAALSEEKVYEDMFSLTDENEMGHIQLSRDADLVVVAPATADLLAKMAHGHANDLATTVLLATDKRILVAPAMNVRMWHHPATVRNLARLQADGVLVVGPAEGSMACGEYGLGRLAEPPVILEAVTRALESDTRLPLPGAAVAPGPLAGRRVVVTSGPTHEPIDPIRYIANRSSGRQGHAIAEAAARAGAEVTLISGPVALADPAGCRIVRVTTAREMAAAVEAALPADIFVAAAAVADWRVEGTAERKIKKAPGASPPMLPLVENPDILAAIGRRTSGRPTLVVGFAAETDAVIENAQAKLARKGADLIVANDVSLGGAVAGGVMGGPENAVTLVSRLGTEHWPVLDKMEVARRLVAHCGILLGDTPPAPS